MSMSEREVLIVNYVSLFVNYFGINFNYICICYLVQSLEDPDSLIEHYVILRGIERFYSEYYTYPGEIDEHVEPDIPKLKVYILK